MAEGKGCLYGDLTALAAAGAMLDLVNPEGAAVLITNFVVRTTVVSTGAATIDAGVSANGATNDELIDGLDVNAALVCESNHDQVTALYSECRDRGDSILQSADEWRATAWRWYCQAVTTMGISADGCKVK